MSIQDLNIQEKVIFFEKLMLLSMKLAHPFAAGFFYFEVC
jgi:hypothetical protein